MGGPEPPGLMAGHNDPSLGYLTTAFASQALWRQDSTQQPATSSSFSGAPGSHAQAGAGGYPPAAVQGLTRGWSGGGGGMSGLSAPRSHQHGSDGSIQHGLADAAGCPAASSSAGPGMYLDPLHSAQGVPADLSLHAPAVAECSPPTGCAVVMCDLATAWAELLQVSLECW